MALVFEICRFGVMNASEGWATCNELDYKLYDDRDLDRSSAPLRKYKGICVLEFSDFDQLGYNTDCETGHVIMTMEIFLRGGATFDQDHVKREIVFLWEEGVEALMEEYLEDSDYSKIVETYAHCFHISDLSFLNYAFDRINKNFGWQDIPWDSNLVNILYEGFGRGSLSTVVASEYLRVLNDIRAVNFHPQIIEKSLEGIILRSVIINPSKIIDVLNYFAGFATQEQLFGGVFSLKPFDVLPEVCEEPIFYVLSKCDLKYLVEKKVLVYLAGLEFPFGKESCVDCLKRYLKVVDDDIHVEDDKPLRVTIDKDDLEATEFLISKGANIRKALSRIRKKYVNKAFSYAKELENLHNILRTQTEFNEDEYWRFYQTLGCVQVANTFAGATFKDIKTAYRDAHPVDPKTGKLLRRPPL